jgi:toxin CptA
MSYYSAKPIHLNLRPSILLATAIAGAFMMASLVLVLLPLNALLKWPLIVLAAFAAGCAMRRDALLSSAHSVVHLSLSQASTLQLTYKDGRQAEVQVLGSSFVSPYLTVVNLQEIETRRRLHVLLLPDSAETNGFRQLRVWLRWGRDVVRESSTSLR